MPKVDCSPAERFGRLFQRRLRSSRCRGKPDGLATEAGCPRNSLPKHWSWPDKLPGTFLKPATPDSGGPATLRWPDGGAPFPLRFQCKRDSCQSETNPAPPSTLPRVSQASRPRIAKRQAKATLSHRQGGVSFVLCYSSEPRNLNHSRLSHNLLSFFLPNVRTPTMGRRLR